MIDLGKLVELAKAMNEEGVEYGVPVRIATPRTLVRMKRDTVRWKDEDDANKLRSKFNITEE